MEATIFLGGLVGFIAYTVGAVISAAAGVWIARNGDRERPERVAVLFACGLTAIWCALAAALGALEPITELSQSARNLALVAVIFHLFSVDGRDESLKPTRPVIAALVLVELFRPALLVFDIRYGAYPQLAQLSFEVSAILQMLFAIGALVLLHNLYVGAAISSRKFLRWIGLGLAGIFAFDLNLATITYLGGEPPVLLATFRGVFTGIMIGLMAFSASQKAADLQFRPSRVVTFQTLSLLLIAAYLFFMALVSRSLALIGEDIARASQIVFLVLAITAAVAFLPSSRMRGWIKVKLVKNLFQHRYDYREEWLRFNRTIGRGSSENASFQQRAVKAVADITDSPAGLLLVPNEEAQLELSARWNWPMIEVPAVASEYELSGLLEQHSLIVDLDEVRGGIDHAGEAAHIPDWLTEADDAWAIVPLIHFDRLVGAIVLGRPRIERRLDWEDFDLLRVVGQQLASYLAEQTGQQALMDASRFDEFNRRMAFVMHDIKNLASQMSLLAANAQKHADKPEFRADMLVTLRNSSDKLSALLARLGRYGAGQAQQIKPFELDHLAKAVCKRFDAVHPVMLTRSDSVSVLGEAEGLEQALVHIVQNAVDASEPEAPIYLNVTLDRLNGQIEVIDSGSGMSPEFVQSGLFKPFVSSKQDGFGIGAFEAREMIKAMGGRLQVESREGVGSRFSITLPLSECAAVMNRTQGSTTSRNEAAHG